MGFQMLVASHYLNVAKARRPGSRWAMLTFAIVTGLLILLSSSIGAQKPSIWAALFASVPCMIEVLDLGWHRIIGLGSRLAAKLVFIAWLGFSELAFQGGQRALLHLSPNVSELLRFQYLPMIQIAALVAGLAYLLVKVFVLMVRRMTIFSTISVYGLFLGTAALVIVLSVMSGFEQDLKKKILGTNAHIVVTTVNDAPFTDYEAVRDTMAKVPGVIGASPYLENEVMMASQSNLSGVIVKGIDPATVGQVTDLPRTIEIGSLEYLSNPDKLKMLGGPPIFDEDEGGEGRKQKKGEGGEEKRAGEEKKGDTIRLVPSDEARRMLDDSAPPRRVLPGVIIGRELAKNLRLYPGDDVNIVSPFGGIGPSGAIPKSKPFRVAGIFFSGMFEYDTKYVYLAIPAAQKFFDQQGRVTGVEAKVRNADETEPVVARLQQALGAKYEVRDWKELNKSLFSALKIEKILMFVLLCFIILVAAFSIIANGTMLVMEKGREIAILKAMGASDSGVLGTFLMLGLFIGSLGTVTGIAVGILGCMALGRFGLPLNPEVYYITTLPVKMNGYEIVAVAVAALLIALGATLYPAWMAARLRPVEGLRDAQR